jgi:hypothetical protein
MNQRVYGKYEDALAEVERLEVANARGQEYSQQLIDENERLRDGMGGINCQKRTDYAAQC